MQACTLCDETQALHSVEIWPPPQNSEQACAQFGSPHTQIAMVLLNCC
jgi:hypothetical protein